jgi:hypothetical protein
MSDDTNFLKGIAVMALLSIIVGLFVVASMSTTGTGDRYTAMYMNTSLIDRNITKSHASLDVPFFVENREGKTVNYRYNVSLLFKDSIFHKGIDAWSEDLNVDEQNNVASGNITVGSGKTETVVLHVPIRSSQKWRYASTTIDLYKEGSPDVYRTLRIWAFNQTV